MKIIFAVFSIIIMFSCTKTEEIIPVVQGIKYGDIEVEVLFCEDAPQCLEVHPVFGANVFIYDSAMNQKDGRKEIRQGQTDVMGKVKFNSLDSFYVFVTVTHDTLFSQTIESLPQNTLSFHQIVFTP